MITRSSKHILKFSNQNKISNIDILFHTFQKALQEYVDMIWEQELPLKNNLSSKDLPDVADIRHSRWKQLIYKHASEIIRANIKRKKKSKPVIKNVGINLDERFFDLMKEKNSVEFDEFIRIKLPWFQENKKLSQTINLPIKFHKQSLKFKDWNLKKTIRLTKKNDNYFIWFIYEKDEPEYIKEGKSIGIDCGYKTLVATSDGDLMGRNIEDIYNQISRKKRNSKNYIQAIEHKKNAINKVVNDLFKSYSDLNHIVIEDLKNVKKNSKGKINKKFNNKLQYWSYKQFIFKMEQACQEKGILLEKVSPAYTSQTCSKCGKIDKSSRKGELYQCSACGLKINADTNASINILHRGTYSSSNSKSIFIDFQC